MRELIERAIADESAQDIIEYALLAGFIGIVGILAWQNIAAAVGFKYLGWDSGIQAVSGGPAAASGGALCTPDPGGGGC